MKHNNNYAAAEVLVVIDMQSFFPASNNPSTVRAVMREVEAAVKANQPVILVEFEPEQVGRTHDCILRLLKHYGAVVSVTKTDADGSREVLEACLINGIPSNQLRVCGVNSDACVLETIQGFLNLAPESRITVVKDACNCLTGSSNDVWSEDFPALPVVVLQ